jgi:hypothetical protein
MKKNPQNPRRIISKEIVICGKNKLTKSVSISDVGIEQN